MKKIMSAPAEVTDGDLDADAILGSGAASIVARVILEQGLGGGRPPLVGRTDEKELGFQAMNGAIAAQRLTAIMPSMIDQDVRGRTLAINPREAALMATDMESFRDRFVDEREEIAVERVVEPGGGLGGLFGGGESGVQFACGRTYVCAFTFEHDASIN